jgi:hypothetical protein
VKYLFSWIVQAMQLELNYRNEMLSESEGKHVPFRDLAYLSPTEIKQLLLNVVPLDQHDERLAAISNLSSV